MKTCSKCKIEKPVEEFYKGRTECKECGRAFRKENAEKIAAKAKKYREENKEHLDQKAKEYRQKNAEEIKRKAKEKRSTEEYREYCRQYHAENKESIHKSQKKYRDKNKEKIAAKNSEKNRKNKDKINQYNAEYYSKPENRRRRIERERAWREKNKEKLSKQKNARRRARKKEDVVFKISCNLRSSFYGAIKRGIKKTSVLNLLGCSVPEFKSYMQSKFLPGMTWDNWGHGRDKWNMDHIVPVSSFDMSNFEDQKKCYHYSNFQPLWHIDNILKSDTLPCGKKAKEVGKVGSQYATKEVDKL